MGDVTPTKRAIAHRAAELFESRGVGNTSVGDICRAAGVARSTLYYHFKSKSDIVRYLVSYEYLAAELADAARGAGGPGGSNADTDGVSGASGDPLGDSDPVGALLTIPRTFIGHLTKFGPDLLAKVFAQDLTGGEYFFTRDYRNMSRVLVPHIRRAQDAGLITNPCEAAELANLSVFVLSQVAYIWACSGGDFDLATESELHLRKLYGIAPRRA